MVDSYGGYAGYGSPSSAADVKRRLALAMLERGMQGGAPPNAFAGMAQAANSVFGALKLRQLEQQEQTANAPLAGQFGGLIDALKNGSLYGTGNGTGAPPSPAATAPAALPPTPPSASPSSGGGSPGLIQPNLPGWGGGSAAGAQVGSLDPGSGLPASLSGPGLFDSPRNMGAPVTPPQPPAPPSPRPQPAPGAQTGAPDFYTGAAMHETRMQNIPNAAGGAAGGYFQMMPGTWAAARAAIPGLPPSPMAASFDQQKQAYQYFTGQNARALQAAGVPITDKNVFMASFLGAGGATKFFQAASQNPNMPAAAVFPNEAASNRTIFFDPKTGQPRSLNDVYGLMTGSFGSGNTTGFGAPSDGGAGAAQAYANPQGQAPAVSAINGAMGAPGGMPSPPSAASAPAMMAGNQGHLPPAPITMGGTPQGPSPMGPGGNLLLNPPAPPPGGPNTPYANGGGPGNSFNFGSGGAMPPPSTNGSGATQMAGPGAPPAQPPPSMPQPGNGIAAPGPQNVANGIATPGAMQSGNGIGFNPMNSIASMFGMSNPSQAQSGNSQTAAAANGTPAGLDPQILQRVMLDPYSSPQAKELAGQILNTYLAALAPHQLRDVVDPRTGVTYQVDSVTGRIRGTLPTGKAPEFSVIGKDATGAETYGWRDPVTQQITPYQPQGQVTIPPYPGAQPGAQPQPQPGASAPPVAAPSAAAPPQAGPQPAATPPSPLHDASIPGGPVQGESYLDGVLAKYPNNPTVQTAVNLARGYLRGDLPLPTGQAGEKPAETMARQLVAAVPGFNAGIYAQRQKALTDYNDGTTPNSAGGMITNANAAVGHLSDLMDASEQLGQAQNGHGPLLNEILGWKADHIDGSGPLADARKRFQAAVTPFAGEITKFFTGSEGDAATREAYRDIIDENQTPEQRRAAAQTLAAMLQTKIGVLAQRYKSATGGQTAYPVELQQAQDQLARIMKLGQPQQGQQGQQPAQGDQTQAAPELTEQQYNAAPSGTRYRVPGSSKVMVKP